MISGCLEPRWLERAEAVGLGRQTQDDAMGRRHRYGFTGNGLAVHRQGAYAEAFVAQTYDLPWDHPLEFHRRREPDVGPVDVRSTKYRPAGLKIHPSDPDDRITVAVCCPEDPRPDDVLQIVGWDYAGSAKIPAFLTAGSGRGRAAYYFIPWGGLRLPSALFDVLAELMP